MASDSEEAELEALVASIGGASDEWKTQPLEFYNYYKDVQKGEEYIDERSELLTNVFGPDIPLLIMQYVNAIYSILSKPFQIEIYYDTAIKQMLTLPNSKPRVYTKYSQCTCKLYFNRKEEVRRKNSKQNTALIRVPFECAMEIDVKIDHAVVCKDYACTAKVCNVFVDKNAKLNVQQRQRTDRKDQQGTLMECIVIEMLDKPDAPLLPLDLDWHKRWRDVFVIESDALTEFLQTDEEYGPIFYREQPHWSSVTISPLPLLSG